MSTLRRAFLALLVLCAVGSASPFVVAGQVTWSNPAGGSWFEPANWTPDVPSAADDVVIDLAGEYVITIEGALAQASSLTLAAPGVVLQNDGFLLVESDLVLGGSGLSGGGDVTVGGDLRFESGTISGSGLLHVSGGVDFATPATKTIAARNLEMHGTGTWSGGDISTSDGVGVIVLGTISMTGGSTQWTDDGSGQLIFDGGALHVARGGTIGRMLGLDPAVTLQSSGRLQVDTGLELRGGGALHGEVVTFGTLSLSAGNFVVSPSARLTGDGDLRVEGGDVTLDSSVEMSRGFVTATVPTLSQSGGTIDVDGDVDVGSSLVRTDGTMSVGGNLTASNVENQGGHVGVNGTLRMTPLTSLSGGKIEVNGNLDIQGGTQSGGLFDGPGTVTSCCAYSWSGGTWAGTGQTITHGSLSISGPATKIVRDRQVTSLGAVTWSGGDIDSSQGATWRFGDPVFTGTLSSAGGVWTGDGTGELIFDGALVADCCGTIGLAPDVTINSAGLLDVADGADLSTGERLTVSGDLEVHGTLQVESGSLKGPGASLLTLGTLRMVSDLSHDLVDPSQWNWSPGSVLQVVGGVGGVPGNRHGWSTFEVAGIDLGPTAARTVRCCTSTRSSLTTVGDRSTPTGFSSTPWTSSAIRHRSSTTRWSSSPFFRRRRSARRRSPGRRTPNRPSACFAAAPPPAVSSRSHRRVEFSRRSGSTGCCSTG
jgi:hypothetical protein